MDDHIPAPYSEIAEFRDLLGLQLYHNEKPRNADQTEALREPNFDSDLADWPGCFQYYQALYMDVSRDMWRRLERGEKQPPSPTTSTTTTTTTTIQLNDRRNR